MKKRGKEGKGKVKTQKQFLTDPFFDGMTTVQIANGLLNLQLDNIFILVANVKSPEERVVLGGEIERAYRFLFCN